MSTELREFNDSYDEIDPGDSNKELSKEINKLKLKARVIVNKRASQKSLVTIAFKRMEDPSFDTALAQSMIDELNKKLSIIESYDIEINSVYENSGDIFDHVYSLLCVELEKQSAYGFDIKTKIKNLKDKFNFNRINIQIFFGC